MRKHLSFVAVTVMALSVLGTVACKKSPDERANEAVTLVRAMDQELLSAQKAAMQKFKAEPDADDIRIMMGANFDGWAVSEKCLSKNEDSFEQALINYQKDSKGDALVGELRLYTKKFSKASQEAAAEYQSRIAKSDKEVATGKFTVPGLPEGTMTEEMKKANGQRRKVFALQVEYEKACQTIADAYTAKLEKLLG